MAVLRTGRLGVALALLLGLGAAMAYGVSRWSPDANAYPSQGPVITAENGLVRWGPLEVAGADFVYLVATSGEKGRNPHFAANREGALAADMPYGAVHVYALCALASEQSANFDLFVPRDPHALPPAVLIDEDSACATPPTRALLISELTTFLNQIEAHVGKQALLAPSPAIEERYRLSSAINRTLWLRRDFLAPDYGARPWVMWQANRFRRVGGVDGMVGWNVVAPRS